MSVGPLHRHRLRAGCGRAVLAVIVGALTVVRASGPTAAAPTASVRAGGLVANAGTVAGARRAVQVVVHAPALDADAVARAVGAGVGRRLGDGAFVLRAPAGTSVSRLRAAVDAVPGVVASEPDVVLHAASLPDDPCLRTCGGDGAATTPDRGGPQLDEWAPAQIGAPVAWDATHGASAARVALLDTRVDRTHPDLVGKVDDGGTFVSNPLPGTEWGHGTHLAGLIAAATNNGIGVAGIGWDTHVLAVTVLDDTGSGEASDIAAGLDAAVAAGARVINLSLTATDDPPVLREAVRRAVQAGAVVVAASGNEGAAAPDFPAGYPGVIAVAASDRSGAVVGFSNRGPGVGLAAPGVGLVSTYPPSLDSAGRSYTALTGTSMAAAVVSASAALVIAAHPGASAGAVRARLGRAAVPVDGVAWGRLDVGAAVGPVVQRYWLVAADGGIFSFGGAPFLGSFGSSPSSSSSSPAGAATAPPAVIGLAPTPSGHGYWIADAQGLVRAFGDAPAAGDAAGFRLNAPVQAMAATVTGAGYWLVAGDGGVFSFGDAAFRGSTGSRRLQSPVVGLVPTPSGLGYWLVGGDGGVFSFGDAPFLGSTGAVRLHRPIVGMAATPSGRGYWLVASDGGVFAFGDAPFAGSTGSLRLNAPVVGLQPTPTGLGYWLVAADGGVFAYGDARYLGSAGSTHLNRPIVGLAG